MVTKKLESRESLALKIDAITEQERKLWHEQDSIHKRLMILKEKKMKLVTNFVETLRGKGN